MPCYHKGIHQKGWPLDKEPTTRALEIWRFQKKSLLIVYRGLWIMVSRFLSFANGFCQWGNASNIRVQVILGLDFVLFRFPLRLTRVGPGWTQVGLYRSSPSPDICDLTVEKPFHIIVRQILDWGQVLKDWKERWKRDKGHPPGSETNRHAAPCGSRTPSPSTSLVSVCTLPVVTQVLNAIYVKSQLFTQTDGDTNRRVRAGGLGVLEKVEGGEQ
jgi:hypothetical protein